eukprot:jgi/Mesvir1/22550/Mv18565-RA.3
MPGIGSGYGQLPASIEADDSRESVEWVNMVFQKMFRVYQKSLANWLISIIQPLIDDLVDNNKTIVQYVKIKGFILGVDPLRFQNMQRKSSRQSNDLQYQLDLVYNGGSAGARVFLELGLGRTKQQAVCIPICVYNLDLVGRLWVKLRLSPSSPFVGNVYVSLVDLPDGNINIAPFGFGNLMQIPFLNRYLFKLLTVDLPSLFLMPKAIVFDLSPNTPDEAERFRRQMKEGVPVPYADSYVGELTVVLLDAEGLPAWNLLGGGNDPFCVVRIGTQQAVSKQLSETAVLSKSRLDPSRPAWNQVFTFLVEDKESESLEITVRNRLFSSRHGLGSARLELSRIEPDKKAIFQLPLLPKGGRGRGREMPRWPGATGASIRVEVSYKSFVADHLIESLINEVTVIDDNEEAPLVETVDSKRGGEGGKGGDDPAGSGMPNLDEPHAAHAARVELALPAQEYSLVPGGAAGKADGTGRSRTAGEVGASNGHQNAQAGRAANGSLADDGSREAVVGTEVAAGDASRSDISNSLSGAGLSSDNTSLPSDSSGESRSADTTPRFLIERFAMVDPVENLALYWVLGALAVAATTGDFPPR